MLMVCMYGIYGFVVLNDPYNYYNLNLMWNAVYVKQIKKNKKKERKRVPVRTIHYTNLDTGPVPTWD